MEEIFQCGLLAMNTKSFFRFPLPSCCGEAGYVLSETARRTAIIAAE